uniref:Uncharacterized protein n=1 Tax=Vibrio genomosp. F6 TaxID=723172 RepID=A0A0H3ZYE1_9VIBR|nr:hypothetical protein [Vibrio genomosp. F6]
MITEFNVNRIIECYLSDSTKPLSAVVYVARGLPGEAALSMAAAAPGAGQAVTAGRYIKRAATMAAKTGPAFKTSKEAVKHAETMGYKEVKGTINKAKQKVLHNKKES